MGKYTVETLIPLNAEYHIKHKVSQSDVEMANKHKTIIEASRTNDRIQLGDIVELTTQYGVFYENAHIDKWDEASRMWVVCETPFTPFVWHITSESNIKFSTGGGAWTNVPNDIKLIGKRKKLFKIWGHCGCCESGAVSFEAEVNVWEYKHPEPFHGEYSTKDYDRYYISHSPKKEGKPSKYSIHCCRYDCDSTFDSVDDYSAWLKTFRGVEFMGYSPNQLVIFCYKRIEKLVSVDEYNVLGLPKDTRECNGVIEVKVFYDDALRTVTEYRYTNSGRELRDMGVKPYLLARQEG